MVTLLPSASLFILFVLIVNIKKETKNNNETRKMVTEWETLHWPYNIHTNYGLQLVWNEYAGEDSDWEGLQINHILVWYIIYVVDKLARCKCHMLPLKMLCILSIISSTGNCTTWILWYHGKTISDNQLLNKTYTSFVGEKEITQHLKR